MFLNHTKHNIKNPTLVLPGSKSESNRALILGKFLNNLDIESLSSADDTKVLQTALQGHSETINIGHAGTAMRFLTAYFAVTPNTEHLLTGSSRMQQRPIKPLVDALQALGADIEYVNNEGYPPLRVRGQRITKNEVSIQADVSSQYSSALMLVAPFLERGLTINLKGNITSWPYLNMTINLIRSLGIDVSLNNQSIVIKPFNFNDKKPRKFTIESDWSSASYHYSALALSSIGTQMTLQYFKPNSLQGDQALVSIYKTLGIETSYIPDHTIKLTKTTEVQVSEINLDLNHTPDLAQTIAVTCLGLGIKAQLFGLQTLKIKETNRLLALKTEMEKLGADVEITDSTLALMPHKALKANVSIDTYEDHRMAMAFAPLSLLTPIEIKNPSVVTKSYPDFWENWEKMFK